MDRDFVLTLGACLVSYNPGSVTDAITQLGKHDQNAAQMLWDRFFERLCAFAEAKIYNRHKRMVSPDELAAQAFMGLVEGVRAGRFHSVRNRDDLWQMLTLITARKAVNARKRLDRIKRGGGKVRGHSAFGKDGINSVVDYVQRDPAPDVGAELQEVSQQLLTELPTDELRNVAVWRMAGYSNAEIAEKLGCTERTVERKLNLIRKIWTDISGESSDE